MEAGYELADDGGLFAPEIGRDHASSSIHDELRAVGLRSVFGPEVKLNDGGEQSEDAGGSGVLAFVPLRGGCLVQVA